jgi:hypothetical protein
MDSWGKARGHLHYPHKELHKSQAEISSMTREREQRLEQSRQRTAHWKRWGPYLGERQWGTVREDYSPEGMVWDYFPHEHARSRAYRWGEDGIAGICDLRQLICFALAFWNGRDPILKERLFGLTGNEGNHGEDNTSRVSGSAGGCPTAKALGTRKKLLYLSSPIRGDMN